MDRRELMRGVVESVAQCGERRVLGRPGDHPDRDAAARERGGDAVATRPGGDGEDEQRLVVDERAPRECLRVAARLLAQPLVVLGPAVELEQEAQRPASGQEQLAVAVRGCLT